MSSARALLFNMRLTSLVATLLSFIFVCLLGALAAGPASRSPSTNTAIIHKHYNPIFWPTQLITSVANTRRTTLRQHSAFAGDPVRVMPYTLTVDIGAHVVDASLHEDDTLTQDNESLPVSWLDLFVKVQANYNILPTVNLTTIINTILFIDALILAVVGAGTKILSEMVPRAIVQTHTLAHCLVNNARGIHRALDAVSQANSNQLLAPRRHPGPLRSRRASLLSD
ncbi:hypothetical protein BOTBODRAFT_147603 [Botryobasidium botryosum FD-172 SS1]|uniref:Uncharacterized protein n=1 Tax=Botryobasidium botryosum (strain FD-172 SS1) TaxID=930990 RepID=A0A067MFM5_BOTB1|nr:hypothetical protein BOTBODRAFT_147603 [Botryobasidium botryosum FD-172 SS1]